MEDAATTIQPTADRSRWPKHIAVIMDGNGRWASQQGLPRSEGHRQGSHSVQNIVEYCARIGIEALTLYCLSNENWKRPDTELQFLMHLLGHYMIEERERLSRNNIRLHVLGRRDGIPDDVWEKMEETKRLTESNEGLTLCLAINYGSRQEIVDAIQLIAYKVKSGELQPDQIDETLIDSHLYTSGIPDPDLLIRTAGEMRISNYLLWQISYSEIWVTDKCWPEFGEQDLQLAIDNYASRSRKYGGLEDQA